MKAIWAKRVFYGVSYHRKKILRFWKGESSQTLLDKWECHCLPAVEEEIHGTC